MKGSLILTTNWQQSTCERDLVIDIVSNLTLEHLNRKKKCKEADYLPLNIKIACKCMDIKMFRRVFAAYIKPKLKYGATVW